MALTGATPAVAVRRGAMLAGTLACMLGDRSANHYDRGPAPLPTIILNASSPAQRICETGTSGAPCGQSNKTGAAAVAAKLRSLEERWSATIHRERAAATKAATAAAEAAAAVAAASVEAAMSDRIALLKRQLADAEQRLARIAVERAEVAGERSVEASRRCRNAAIGAAVLLAVGCIGTDTADRSTADLSNVE